VDDTAITISTLKNTDLDNCIHGTPFYVMHTVTHNHCEESDEITWSLAAQNNPKLSIDSSTGKITLFTPDFVNFPNSDHTYTVKVTDCLNRNQTLD